MLRGRSALEGATANNLDKIIMAVVTSVKASEWDQEKVVGFA